MQSWVARPREAEPGRDWMARDEASEATQTAIGWGENGLVRAHAVAALAMVAYVVLLGLAVALKFPYPDLMGRSAPLTWGRMRYAHTQGVFFGWLGNAFLAFCYHAVPRLAGRPITSRALGWILFFGWNFLLVLPGWALVQSGRSQPLEWGEFPLAIDAVAVACLALAGLQFVLPICRARLADLYVSGWYILGGLVFTAFAYPVGNFVPEIEPGAKGAAYSGLWIHDAVGLFVTPLALAIAYIVIPAVSRKPIFSHFLSMLGFWLLFLVYPLNGTHHYLFSSIPMEAQKGAVVASVYLGVDVILVVSNLLLSLRGSGGTAYRDASLRFVWVGIVCYLVVSLQGSLQALMPFNRFVHFTDWVIGHAHLAMIGFASFTAIGGLLFAWQRLPRARYNARAADWSFWLLTLGLAAMVLDLTAAGLLQGQLWSSDLAWMESVRASRPYWFVRVLSGVPILLGFAALAVAISTGTAAAEASEPGPAVEAGEPAAGALAAWLHDGYVVAGVAGLGFFALSFLALAVWPNRTISEHMNADRPPGVTELAANELRGRAVYSREGCVNCHSQFVRSSLADVRRFGVASQAWETAEEFPQLWGTRRVGPDLAREHGRRPADWQLVHLYNPRFVVPDSIMPGYPWLFAGSPAEPTQDALDLAAYLESLGRAAAFTRDPDQKPPASDPETERQMGIFCDCAIPRTRGPAVQLSMRMPDSERERFTLRGAEVFSRECSGCHGQSGKGDGPAAQALLPRPRDLSSARFSDRALSEVLWAGARGSSMPGWSELPIDDLRGLAAFIQSSGPGASAPGPALDASRRKTAAALFQANCALCHGREGQGDGPNATVLAPAPTAFLQIQPSLDHAKHAIADGVPGTAMPPWKSKLTEADRELLALYLRTFYRED